MITPNLQQLTDEHLFQLVQQGLTDALSEIYRRYSHRLLHYLLRLLNGDESRAQDLLQDVFVRVLEKRNLFRTGHRFSTWLFTIAHNICKNEYRTRTNRNEVDLNETGFAEISTPDYIPLPFEKIDREIFLQKLLIMLKSFSVEQRSTFLLRFQENLTVREIASIMNCSEGTVKSRLHYTLSRIAGQLKAYDLDKFEVT